MKILITLNTDNDAFEGYPELEVSRILNRLVLSLRGYSMQALDGMPLLDANGNTVGTFELVKSTAHEHRDVEELLRLADTLITSATSQTDDYSTVSKEALELMEDWIVNRFGDD